MDHKEGKFTYSDSKNVRWNNELFENQEDVFNKACEKYENFLIGQLKRVGHDYIIINVMEFSEI